MSQISPIHITYNQELVDKIAIEYMKAMVTADPMIGHYDIANRSYDFAYRFLEIRQNFMETELS